MNRISLSERLERLDQGQFSDPEAGRVLIESIVFMPLRSYIHPNFQAQLAEALGMDPESPAFLNMPYGEAAARVRKMWSSPACRGRAEDAVWSMFDPFFVEYKWRKQHAAN